MSSGNLFFIIVMGSTINWFDSVDSHRSIPTMTVFQPALRVFYGF